MPWILKKISILAIPLFLSACFGGHYFVHQDTLMFAEQCLKEQHQFQVQTFEQQQAINTTLSQLNTILSEPLRIDSPTINIMQKPNSLTDITETTLVRTVNLPSDKPITTLPENKLIVGEIENVWLPELNLILQSRIDTGATTASLDAREIQSFERDGEQWVRFNMLNPETKQAVRFERKQVRKVKVNQSNTPTPETRFVIELQVVLGGVSQLAEFTLSDRSHLGYQVLIGRNVLRDVMIVDISQSHIAPLPNDISP